MTESVSAGDVLIVADRHSKIFAATAKNCQKKQTKEK